jgi:antirestriction protein ArdC
MPTTYARRPAQKKRTSERADVYQQITDQVIELLESGTAPWRKPWRAAAGGTDGLPVSMSTKKPYRGINIFLLATAAQAKGYSCPWWGTYNQITERGGQVKRGEKGTMIVFWKMLKKENEETGKSQLIPLLRTFTVFNADQTENGMPNLSRPELVKSDPIEAIAECDAAVAAYLATGPTLMVGGDRACYSWPTDQVRMPERDSFKGPEEYYSTLFHELTHSTGHESRLKRPDLLNFHYFGDESYSKEELVAEMGASFLAGITGIATTTLPNSAAYLASWLKALKNDKKLLVTAAAQAQKAADLILGIKHEEKAED